MLCFVLNFTKMIMLPSPTLVHISCNTPLCDMLYDPLDGWQYKLGTGAVYKMAECTFLYSFQGSRLMHLQQAASLFLREIIEDRALVAIVEFNSVPSIKKPLTMIDGQSREELVSALPNRAIGSTSMCQGITIAIQVKSHSDCRAPHLCTSFFCQLLICQIPTRQPLRLSTQLS